MHHKVNKVEEYHPIKPRDFSVWNRKLRLIRKMLRHGQALVIFIMITIVIIRPSMLTINLLS